MAIGLSTAGSVVAEESGLGSAGARGARWQQSTVDINVEASVDLLGDAAFDSVIAAATTWENSPGELPTVVVTRGPEDPIGYRRSGPNRNTVRFSPDGDPLANGALAITVITFDAQAKQILDADIVLNGEHTFGFFSPDKKIPGVVYDLQNVLTHEMGHFFGLGEQFEDEDATMYAYSQAGEIVKRDLGEADITEISTLYREAYIPEEGPSCAGATIAGYDGEAWSWAMLWLVALALVMRRRATREMALGCVAVSLVVGSALYQPESAEFSTVTSVDSHWEGGLIVSRVTLMPQRGGTDFETVVLGGQIGNISQQVGRLMPPRKGDVMHFEGATWIRTGAGASGQARTR